MEIFSDMTYWHWLVFGLGLIVLEILLPSAIFLWPGIAAIFIGILAFIVPSISATTFILIWAVLSVSFAFGWQMYRKSNPVNTPISSMNKRGTQYVGRHFTLLKDIINGVGELNVDDTRWKIISNFDHSVGTRVKVIAVEGTSLRVEEFIS